MKHSHKRFFTAALFLVTVFLFNGAGGAAEPISQSKKIPPMIRVLVAENQQVFRVNVKGAYALRALPSLKVLKQGERLSDVNLSVSSRGFYFGKEEFLASGIRIKTAGDRDLRLNQSQFRGTLDIFKDRNGSMFAVNRIGIEDYLYGVLPHEVAFWWPTEALKAQSIAARTYALYQARVSAAAEFDVKSGTSSQVYGGTARERFRTNRAVDETRGQVLTYQGKLFPAYFHATCAGTTAAAKELWKIDLPPLAGGVKCGYCRLSPHYSWEATIPLSEIEQKMSKYGRPAGQILKIEIISLTPSGRVGSLRITGTSQEAVIAAKDFRVWIGGDRIRSTHFTVVISEDAAKFRGKGWGHGVGLCQWGTFGQALFGHPYDKILEFYYPGSKIVSDAS